MSPAEESALVTRRQTRLGIIAALGAYIIWGIAPIFFKQFVDIAAPEIIAHRVVWSLLLMIAILGPGRSAEAAWSLVRQPRLVLRVYLGAILVISNWLIFVYGVTHSRILETSLGYFILPLVSVALGTLMLGERLHALQKLAVAFAIAGVALEAWRIGGLPWLSLALAGTFGVYGLLRKQLNFDAVTGLYLETACLTPFAVAYLAWLYLKAEHHFGRETPLDLLLIASGAVTAIPLLLFAIGTRRLPLKVIGFLQYIGPTISFAVAVLIYDEAMNPLRLTSFALIWIGLAVFTADLLRRRSF